MAVTLQYIKGKSPFAGPLVQPRLSCITFGLISFVRSLSVVCLF